MPLQVEWKWEKGNVVEEKIYKHLLRISIIRLSRHCYVLPGHFSGSLSHEFNGGPIMVHFYK